MSKKLLCLRCGRETRHVKRKVKAKTYDRHGRPETVEIDAYFCTVCGRPAGA